MLKGNAQYGKEFGSSITVPNVVKVFMLSASKNTLPTKANLVKRKVIDCRGSSLPYWWNSCGNHRAYLLEMYSGQRYMEYVWKKNIKE
jgi:hypothetical protein